MTPTMSDPIISARGLSKTFGDRTVLRAVDLEVRAGEVHGLLGQNGSGKSTLIKILGGYHAPDPGVGAQLAVRGEPVALPLRPGQPSALGLSFVHQDLGLSPSMTVLENLRVGSYQTRGGWRIDWRRERRIVAEALERFDVEIAPDTPLGSLTEAERAMVAIVRAAEHMRRATGEPGLLVLDEPTASLPYDSVDRLFTLVREVAARGAGVLFVSHRLDEVRSLTQRVTVLRDGSRVATTETAGLDEDQLVELILGRSMDQLYPEPHHVQGELRLAARNVCGKHARDVDVTVRRGEIVGLTGLFGMGHEELPYLLFGAQRARSGSLEIDGKARDLRRLTPRDAIGAGLALIPGNRLQEGGTSDASVGENLTLPTVRRHFAGGRLRLGAETREVARLLSEYEVTPPDPDRPFGTLSGGNQQKTLIAKWFRTNPQVLLLHEPTQGVDIGARAQILRRIRDAAEGGTAVILASGEYEDLAHLCDRVMVFRHGRVVSELSGEMLSQDRIVEQCFRAGAGEAGRAPVPAMANARFERQEEE